MIDHRLRSLAAIVAVVAALTVVWWIDRGDQQVRQINAPVVGADAPPVDASWIADHAERAAVLTVVEAIDRGGRFGFRDDGEVFENREGRLPRRPPSYWRAYTVAIPGDDDRGLRRVVVGARHELYYTRDHYQSLAALRGATP